MGGWGEWEGDSGEGDSGGGDKGGDRGGGNRGEETEAAATRDGTGEGTIREGATREGVKGERVPRKEDRGGGDVEGEKWVGAALQGRGQMGHMKWKQGKGVRFMERRKNRPEWGRGVGSRRKEGT